MAQRYPSRVFFPCKYVEMRCKNVAKSCEQPMIQGFAHRQCVYLYQDKTLWAVNGKKRCPSAKF